MISKTFIPDYALSKQEKVSEDETMHKMREGQNSRRLLQRVGQGAPDKNAERMQRVRKKKGEQMARDKTQNQSTAGIIEAHRAASKDYVQSIRYVFKATESTLDGGNVPYRRESCDRGEIVQQIAPKEEFRFTLKGEPIGKARHRTGKSFNGKLVHFNAQHLECKTAKIHLLSQRNASKYGPPKTCSLIVNVKDYMPIPDSWPAHKKNLALYGLIKPATKPDKDNLDKFIFDVGNGILWVDDKQIIDGRTTKLYSLYPRTEVIVMSAEPKLSAPAESILGNFGPDKLVDFLEDANDLYMTYYLGRTATEFPDEYLEKAASIISRIASRYGSELGKIHKTHPHWYNTSAGG